MSTVDVNRAQATGRTNNVLTTDQVAKRLGVTRQQVHWLGKTGRLGKRIMAPRENLVGRAWCWMYSAAAVEHYGTARAEIEAIRHRRDATVLSVEGAEQALYNPQAQYLDDHDVARMLSIPRGTLRHWRQWGEGPPWVKIDRFVRYSVTELNAWLAARTRE